MEPATATIVPTLDGFAEGFVVFRFLKTAAHLDLGENDVLRIYKGTWPFGEVLHTIDRSNQEQYPGNAVVVEGKATLVYTGAANNDLRFRYYTGDYTFTTHLGQPMAIWSDFIEPNSHVVVDDNYMDGAEFLPVIFAHFDEQKIMCRRVLHFACKPRQMFPRCMVRWIATMWPLTQDKFHINSSILRIIPFMKYQIFRIRDE